MKIAVACDHAAFDAMQHIVAYLKTSGNEVLSFGCHDTHSCDYPDYALPAATAVANGEAERGVLLCGTGIGMSIAANKVRGIRAALVTSSEAARLTREHNDSNIICMPARFATPDEMIGWLSIWLATPFSNEPRHIQRIAKIDAIEAACHR